MLFVHAYFPTTVHSSSNLAFKIWNVNHFSDLNFLMKSSVLHKIDIYTNGCFSHVNLSSSVGAAAFM
jgi:hypothetical protein